MNAEDLKLLAEAKTLREQNVLTAEEYGRLYKSVFRPSRIGPAIRDAVELGAKLAWPVLALLAIFLFYQPLKSKIAESAEIGVGSFVLKIRETAMSAGNPALADLLGRLSDDAIAVLMESRQPIGLVGQGQQGAFLNPRISTYRELESHGLFKASEPIERFEAFFWSLQPDSLSVDVAPDSLTFDEALRTNRLTSERTYYLPSALRPDTISRIHGFNGELTPRGKQAHDLIIKVVADQLSSCRPPAT